VEVLVGTDYVSARCLGRAECVGSPVVDCGDGQPRRQSGGCAPRGSSAPPCSADNRWTCCGIKESLLFVFIANHILYYDVFSITSLQ
jgi:hypothetical protein